MDRLSHRLLSKLSPIRLHNLARRIVERPESHLRSAKLARLEEWLDSAELASLLARVAQ